MDTISLYRFPSFVESSQEVAAPTFFSLDIVCQIEFNVLVTLQLSMASIEGFPNAEPSPTHSAVVVTPTTLW